MTTITVQNPARAVAPRSSSGFATAFSALTGWFQRQSAQRADLQGRAERLQEAAAVREYAQRYARHDPRFAADLLAAADRHENAQ
jgi:hypothetical protein